MKLFVSILNEGNIRTELARELVVFGRNAGPSTIIEYSSDRPIDSNRNGIVQRFLETDCDFLLQIDSDTVPTRSLLNTLPDKYDIFTAPTPIFSMTNFGYAVYYNIFKYDQDKNYIPIYKDESSGIIKVDACGGGCLLIRRTVLEKIRHPFSRITNKDGIDTLGSDLHFCEKCTELGFEIYADLDNPCKHFKTVDVGLFLNHGKQNTRPS